jgi:hypothetical protein
VRALAVRLERERTQRPHWTGPQPPPAPRWRCTAVEAA